MAENIYRELYFTRESLKALKAKETRLKKLILEAHEAGAHEVEGYDLKIASSEQSRFDTKGFKASEPDIYLDWLTAVSVTRITIKPIVA